GDRNPDSTVVRGEPVAEGDLRVLAVRRGVPALHAAPRGRGADRREALALGDSGTPRTLGPGHDLGDRDRRGGAGEHSGVADRGPARYLSRGAYRARRRAGQWGARGAGATALPVAGPPRALGALPGVPARSRDADPRRPPPLPAAGRGRR